jgi:hypothetical protein
MTRDDIIRMAREVGLLDHGILRGATDDSARVERFAALVAAAEREQCAKVCEDIPVPQDPTALTHIPTLERCAAAIRARGQ